MKPHANEALYALESTIEAVVLGFHLDASTAQFELVCESYFKHTDANRAFSLFTFFDVKKFNRTLGALDRLKKVTSTFVLRDVVGTWVIQGVGNEQGDQCSKIEISLGHSFGEVEFQYSELTHERIDLYAKAKGVAEWDYFEVGTD